MSSSSTPSGSGDRASTSGGDTDAAVESGFAPTEMAAPGLVPPAADRHGPAPEHPSDLSTDTPADTPEAAAPDTDLPDVLVDLEFDVPPARSNLAGEPTLSHIGRYALKHRIGMGGLGTVYEAWDPLLSRTVAVKTLHFAVDTPSRLSLDGLFLNEARTAASLSHRYIVTVHDAGLSAQGVYIAMERLHGRDLRDALAHGWRPSPERAALLMRRVCDAVAYAHHRGVVHCDLKPANIFLTRRWRPKVLDFGISRAVGAAGAAAPALEGLVAGSPHHLAPEQLDGGSLDARTDVYALGTVLYELLTGRKAFEGRSLEAITEAVRQGRVTPVRQWNPDVPDGLAEIAMQALSRDPAHRFATAHDMSLALRPWQSAEGMDTLHTRAVHSTPPGRLSPSTAARTGAAPRRALRDLLTGPKAIVTLTVLAAAGLIVAGGLVALRGEAVVAGSPATLGPALAAPLASGSPTRAPSPAEAGPGPADAAPAGTAPGLESSGPVAPPAETVSAQSPATGPAGEGSPTATSAAPAGPVAGAVPGARAAAPPPRDTPRNRNPRATEAARPGTAAATPTTATAAAGTGTVQVAVTPWGQVEVNGQPAGTTPPLTQLVLPEGRHTVTIRNADFPAYTTTVVVSEDRPVVVRHRFTP